MRTTLTLDDDVAALVEQARKSSGQGLREVINQTLRRGFREMSKEKESSRTQVYTKPVNLGACRIPLISVSEALALSEGDGFR